MAEDNAASFESAPPVADWRQPLEGDEAGPAGADLEYDPEVQELEKAAAGKPETQFSTAEPPDWPQVREMAAALMQRTRDLRIAMHWCRASVALEGFAALPPALCLLQGLLQDQWDHVHPLPDPDDGDTFARVNALGGLDKLDSLLGDVRQALLVNDRRLGGLRVRDVEIALERLAPRPDEEVRTKGQIEAALADLAEPTAVLRAQVAEAQHWMKALQSAMNERFGISDGVDLKNLRTMLAGVESVLPALATDEPADAEADTSDAGVQTRAQRASSVFGIETRAEAVRAIELVCAYLERSEPTNPAQLLLRRAARLIDKNFLQLVQDLAPDALAEVARIMGVDPNELGEH